MSPELQRQLTNWLSDATSSNPSLMCRCYGLCYAVDIDQREELRRYFQKQGLRRGFPFNETAFEYFREGDQQVAHLNPNRLAWVRMMLDVT